MAEDFERLYREMFHLLYIYAQRALDDASLAEEAVQETFCVAWIKAEQVLSSANPRGWLMVTLKHIARNIARSRARRERMEAAPVGPEERAAAPDGENVDLLYSDLADSPDFQLIKLVALERYTAVEAAADLGISVESCKKRRQRARKRLRKKLKDGLDNGEI